MGRKKTLKPPKTCNCRKFHAQRPSASAEACVVEKTALGSGENCVHTHTNSKHPTLKISNTQNVQAQNIQHVTQNIQTENIQNSKYPKHNISQLNVAFRLERGIGV